MCEILVKKQCHNCQEEKELSEFPDRKTPNGYIKHHLCKKCYNRKRYERRMRLHPEETKVKSIERQKRDPECKTKARKRYLKCQYNLTTEQYDIMYKQQDGKCAICKTHKEYKKLYIDHNHSTGKVRALLCHHCNSMIGYAKENPTHLSEAISYLLRHNYS